MTAGPPPNLPANNNGHPWANGDRYDDSPAGPQPVAPYAAGQWHDGNYSLTHINSASYSILVDSHQKKHIASWPSHYQGKAGTKFPLNWTNQDVINYAQLLIPHYAALSTTPATNVIQNNVSLNVRYDPPGGTSKKPKAGVASVIVNTAAWDVVHRYWEFHFYPG